MAAAAITPRWSETALRPASFPGVNLIMVCMSPGTVRVKEGLRRVILHSRGYVRCEARMPVEAWMPRLLKMDLFGDWVEIWGMYILVPFKYRAASKNPVVKAGS